MQSEIFSMFSPGMSLTIRDKEEVKKRLNRERFAIWWTKSIAFFGLDNLVNAYTYY